MTCICLIKSISSFSFLTYQSSDSWPRCYSRKQNIEIQFCSCKIAYYHLSENTVPFNTRNVDYRAISGWFRSSWRSVSRSSATEPLVFRDNRRVAGEPRKDRQLTSERAGYHGFFDRRSTPRSSMSHTARLFRRHTIHLLAHPTSRPCILQVQ